MEEKSPGLVDTNSQDEAAEIEQEIDLFRQFIAEGIEWQSLFK